MFNVPATTLTDTSGSGTIALRGAETINNCTFASTNSETLTNAACLYVGTPSAGSNVTASAVWSAYFASNVYVSSLTTGGVIKIGGGSASSSFPSLYETSSAMQFAVPAGNAGTIDITEHWRLGGAGTPTISSGACGTGTNGAIVAGGNDQSFEVTIGSAATTACTISFASTFSTAPRAAIISPANAAAAATGTTGAYVSSLGTTTVVITGSALANANYYVHVF